MAPPDQPGGGEVRSYTAAGAFVKALGQPAHQPEFHPFGVVIGPDGLLYASSQPGLFTAPAGQVLQFNPTTGRFIKPFVDNDPARSTAAAPTR